MCKLHSEIYLISHTLVNVVIILPSRDNQELENIHN